MARREVSNTGATDNLNMIQKIARKTADVAPIAGGILGGTAGFALGTPTGPGALLSGAAGTAAGTGGGLAIKSGLEQVFKLPTDQTQKERAVESIAEPAIAGAADLATGGILRGAGSLLGKVARGGSKRLMNMAFRESVPETKAVIRAGKETLGEQALTKGEIGTDGSIFQKAIKKIEALENSLQKTLAKAKEPIDILEIEVKTIPLVERYRKAGNLADAVAIENRINAIRSQAISGRYIPVNDANVIKRTLFDEARNAYGKTSSENMEGIKAIARGFRQAIEDYGGKNIAKINKELSYYGRIADSMTDKMTRSGRNKIIDIIVASVFGGGMAAAPATNGLSLLPAVATAALGTTPGQTVTANVLKNLPKIGSKIEPGLDILRRIGTQAVSGAINQ